MSTDPIDLDAIERMAAGSHDPVMALQARALVAEVRRLRDHSTTLNSISWRIAEVLGDVPPGADRIEGNPIEQARSALMADPTPAERYHRDAVPGAPNTPGARQAETDAGRTTGGGDGVRPWTVTPTPAEIDAGATALNGPLVRYGAVQQGYRRTVVEAVLRAVLPGHDARLRAQVGEGIARRIAADSSQSSAHETDDFRAGMRRAMRIAQIEAAHTTGGDHG